MRCAGMYAEILQRGGWEGANMGFFLKRRGQLQAVSGGALEDNI